MGQSVLLEICHTKSLNIYEYIRPKKVLRLVLCICGWGNRASSLPQRVNIHSLQIFEKNTQLYLDQIERYCFNQSHWSGCLKMEVINAGETMAWQPPSYSKGKSSNWYNLFGKQCKKLLRALKMPWKPFYGNNQA